MAKSSKTRKLGKHLLLSIAIGATPVVGTPVKAQTSSDSASGVAAERALFRRASQSGNPALISQFLQQYPDSGLVLPLLENLPPETLQSIDRGVVLYVEPGKLRNLSPGVRVNLGLDAPSSTGSGEDLQTTVSDGYAG